MPTGRGRNLTEKQIYTQVAGSERSGESEAEGSDGDGSLDEELGGPAAADGRSQGGDQGGGGAERGSSSRSSQTSETGRSSSSRAESSKETSEQSSSTFNESSSTTSVSAGPEEEEATDTTPLMQSYVGAKAQAKSGAGAVAKGAAKAKAQAKAQARPAAKVQQVTSRCPRRVAIPCALAAAALLAVLAVYLQWCALSPWSPWGECLPTAPGAAGCGPGLRNRTRAPLRGRCGGRALLQREPCSLGECRVPDYLAEADGLPCNRRSRGQLLREAEAAFGAREWAALRACDRAYLCCHACREVYLAAGPLSCGGVQIKPRPVFAAGDCLSCFAAGPGPGCRGGQAVCRRTFTSAAGGKPGHLCCLSVGPHHSRQRKKASQREPPPDEENFDRRPNSNAVLGVLRDPHAWPVAANEAACQHTCWQDAACSLYVYFSPGAGIRKWRGRCVTWDEETAEEQGRASARSWIPERGIFSGLKAHLSYSDVVVTARTAEGRGSGSHGPFDLFICRDLAHCQLQSPIRITATSCTAGARCMSPGSTAHFVGTVVVPQAFELHAVRVEGHTDDAWVFEALSVDCEGQLGEHRGRVRLGTGSWITAVGCVTTAGWRVTAEPGTPCASACHPGYGRYGWCWADAQHRAWGHCAGGCQQSSPEPSGGEGAAMRRSAVSCAELNWPTWSEFNSNHSVCGASNDWPLHGCSGPLSWDAAKEFCELIGARLCTRGELEADETAGTGCDLDRQHIWSSTPCEHGGYMALPGASRYLGTVEARCTPPASTSAQARCCADSRKVEIVFRRSHRNAHVLPWHMRRGDTPGLASWQVVAGLNHAGEQGFFLQSGMLDDQLPQDSQSVDVLLEEVPVSKLGGEVEFFFRTDTEPGWDRLHFFIDGVEETRGGFPVSGRVPWTLARFSFPAREGTDLHTFLWRFSKDRSDSVGEDVACIDTITVFDVLSVE